MAETEVCPGCGVPAYVTSELLWLDNGVIVQSRDEKHRVVFIECENLDPLFKGIGEIVGNPIERLIVDSRRRGARDYVERFITPEVRETIEREEADIAPIIGALLDSTRMMGFGKPEMAGFRFEKGGEDFFSARIIEPFSVPLWCGSIAGACEAVVGGEWGVESKEISSSEYEITAFRSEHPADLKGKAKRKDYVYRAGEVGLGRCSICNGPTALASFRWDVEGGIIESAYTGRRMSINGETGLQEVFAELEKELGRSIPHAVVEAERQFIKGGFYSIDGLLSEADFRTQFAFRGLGNLSEFRMGATGLCMRLENPTLHLTVVGFAQALYELAFDVQSRVEWEVAASGELNVEVSPR